MKYEDKLKICLSQNWIRIVYQSVSSHGTIIMKRELYDMKEKKMKKIFADCHSVDITFDYQPTMKDIYMSALKIVKERLHYEENRRIRLFQRNIIDKYDIWLSEDRIDQLHKKLIRIERTLNMWG